MPVRESDVMNQDAAAGERKRHRRTERDGVVMITGVNGFLGRALAERLSARYDVVGLDFVLPPDPPPWIESVRFDVTSDASIKAALTRVRAGHGGRIASLIHLAGYYDLSGDPSEKYEAVTVRGTERLLRELRAFDVEQFVFASTMLVHAPTEPGRPIDEDAPLDPKTPYPQSKQRTEALIRAQRGDVPAVLLRFAGVYDEQCRASFLGWQIANIYERRLESFFYPGDPSRGQAYLHVEDLVDAVSRTIERRHELPDETILLLGEPETMGYDELQNAIARQLHGEAIETRSIPPALAKAGQWLQEDVLDLDPFVQPWMIEQASDHYEIDIARAKTLLGWRPRHRLRDTLPSMIAALKADPPGWYAANKLDPARVAAADPVIARAAQSGPPAEEALAAVDHAIETQHRQTLWAPLTNAALGLWLVAAPFAFGLFDPAADAAVPPALGHAAAEAAVRNARLGISDVVSGLAIVLLSLAGVARPRSWSGWAVAAIGVWLMFAPLIFWTSSAAAYASDTMIGMLVIVLAVMVPPQPGISRTALASSADLPLGWSYSPSTYVQRLPIVSLAFLGLLVSRYLAAYQLGHVDRAWDPLFGGLGGGLNGTETVVTSAVSRSFPIADAGFGAIAYALDVLTGAIGDRRRWRTMPWLVLAFGVLIVPLGFVSVGFIIIQPTVIGTLCLLCLLQTLVTVILIPYSIDEVIASIQYLAQSRRAGNSFWRTFWRGGPALQERRDEGGEIGSFGAVMREFFGGGVTLPWTLAASIAVGAWLMLSPVLAGSAPPLYFSDHIAGCLAIAIAATALADVARIVRLLNVPIGLWVAASPFVLAGGSAPATMGDVVAGVALALLSLPRGKLSQAHYGSWDRFIV